jgi:hypothetical protein
MNSLQKFCNNKTIALVGNSSRLLNNKLGKVIDDHDIVIRINHAPRYIKNYTEHVGSKTTIMSYGLTRLDLVNQLSKIANPQYNLFLIRCNGEIKNYSDYSIFKNPYHGSIEEYKELRSIFGTLKPSTGIVTVNFLIKNINFSKLDLYGFDFFSSSSTIKKNEFGSYLYKDHDGELERKYINSILSDKISINY